MHPAAVKERDLTKREGADWVGLIEATEHQQNIVNPEELDYVRGRSWNSASPWQTAD